MRRKQGMPEQLKTAITREYTSPSGKRVFGAFETIDSNFLLVNTYCYESLLKDNTIVRQMTFKEALAIYEEDFEKYYKEKHKDELPAEEEEPKYLNAPQSQEDNAKSLKELRQSAMQSINSAKEAKYKELAKNVFNLILQGKTKSDISMNLGISRSFIDSVLSSLTKETAYDYFFSNTKYSKGISITDYNYFVDNNFDYKLYRQYIKARNTKLDKVAKEKANDEQKKVEEYKKQSEAHVSSLGILSLDEIRRNRELVKIREESEVDSSLSIDRVLAVINKDSDYKAAYI